MKKNISRLLILAMILIVSSSDLLAQTRIRFARGRTSATITGTLGPGAGRRYVFGAQDGQYLKASVTSGNGSVTFGTDGDTNAEWYLDAGDNYIYVENNGNRATSYRMTISIR